MGPEPGADDRPDGCLSFTANLRTKYMYVYIHVYIYIYIYTYIHIIMDFGGFDSSIISI